MAGRRHGSGDSVQQRQDAQAGIVWECKAFPALTGAEVYALLRLRCQQDCAFLDPDGLDQAALHWLGWAGDELVAYQRCLPPGTPYAESSIGRIVTAGTWRGRDLGRELVRRGVAFNRRRWPGHAIRIGAQSRLRRFYEFFGFAVTGDEYMEDGIPHVHMLLAADLS